MERAYNFPAPGYHWAPERIAHYSEMVRIMHEHMAGRGPAPTPTQLHTWSWVAPHGAETLWDDWCRSRRERVAEEATPPRARWPKFFFVIAGLAAVHACSDAGWVAAQLGRSLWPTFAGFSVPTFFANLEGAAYHRWEVYREEMPPLVPLEVRSLLSGPLPDLTQPFVARDVDSEIGAVVGSWNLKRFAGAPIGELNVTYFSDATKLDALVPDAAGRLRDVLASISRGSTAKIGTEDIFRIHPELLDDLNVTGLDRVFGTGHFASDRVGSMLTVPVFYGAGTNSTRVPVRTDLHCEPIANALIQLSGRKRITLVAPEYSRELRPQIARNGRAYFFSLLDPLDPGALSSVPRYVVDAEAGDIVWIPPWTWHRVEYPSGPALSASLFHVRPWEMVTRNREFALLVIPNILKEMIGLKHE